jgi:hypothetical protein
MIRCVRITLSKGSNRLCAFLYLKTEAQPASETGYSIKIKTIDKTKEKEDYFTKPESTVTALQTWIRNIRWLYKSRNKYTRRFLISALRNVVKNRWVTTDRSERPTHCELQFVVVHYNEIPVQRTASAMKPNGVRSAHGNEQTGSKRSVMSDTEPFALAARLHHRSFLCLKFY